MNYPTDVTAAESTTSLQTCEQKLATKMIKLCIIHCSCSMTRICVHFTKQNNCEYKGCCRLKIGKLTPNTYFSGVNLSSTYVMFEMCTTHEYNFMDHGAMINSFMNLLMH